jgi:hypothetical protein
MPISKAEIVRHNEAALNLIRA